MLIFPMIFLYKDFYVIQSLSGLIESPWLSHRSSLTNEQFFLIMMDQDHVAFLYGKRWSKWTSREGNMI